MREHALMRVGKADADCSVGAEATYEVWEAMHWVFMLGFTYVLQQLIQGAVPEERDERGVQRWLLKTRRPARRS